MSPPSWYNGQLHTGDTLPIAPDDPALLFGATVFTTLRIYDRLHDPRSHWSDHVQRLQTSLAALGWRSPNWSQVEQGAIYLADHHPVLRVTLFPDGRHWILGRSLPTNLDHWHQQGITAWVANWDDLGDLGYGGRSLPSHKTGNYLAPWLARQRAQQHQAQEAILVGLDDAWLETSTGNLWGWGAGCYWTPPISQGILPGLARSHLISSLKCQNIEIREEPWCAQVRSHLEAIAYCNSVVEVVPISHVLSGADCRSYDPHHPRLRLLQEAIARPNPVDF